MGKDEVLLNAYDLPNKGYTGRKSPEMGAYPLKQ